MYLVSLSLLAHRHWRADMSMWCIELEIWIVEQRLPPNATATNWTGGNALQYDKTYHQTSNIGRISVGNKFVDHSDIVGASPLGAAPTTSSCST